MFVNDSKKIQTVRMDCGFDNSSEKCNKCDFKTFSFGLLREHQVKSHQSKNSKTKVIEGFEIDDKTYRELLIAMYEEEEILTFQCRMCNAKTNSKGTLRIHENEVHFKKWEKPHNGDPSDGGLQNIVDFYILTVFWFGNNMYIFHF